jgi:REP element-mobilizing transposase RayT
LCGHDRFTGRSFEHRRVFIENEMLRLGKVFYLDLVAYSVMSNHFHVVLFIDQSAQEASNARDVITRWHQLHQGNELSVKYLNNEPLNKQERHQLDVFVDLWRSRLASISWFMRVLNEKVARMANAEDEVTGRFWEGRFKCQALLDEQALLACMAYVDLNPVRAQTAETPERSEHTSIRRRILHWKQRVKEDSAVPPIANSNELHAYQPEELLPFGRTAESGTTAVIPFSLRDYLELVDWTGRQIREGKKGAISADALPILQRLSISKEHWVYLCGHFESRFKGLVGSLNSLDQACAKFKRKRRPNVSASSTLFA